MKSPIEQMLEQYSCSTRNEYERALKEIIQDIALVGLWRAKFFEHAAFYGGTALRILYGLDRFSEDLDFTLLKSDSSFSLDPYNKAIKSELESYGLEVEVDSRSKSWKTPIRSAFIKAKTMGEMIKVGIPSGLVHGLHPDALMKIKLEVDSDPTPAYSYESRFLNRPMSIAIQSVKLEDIFAGKMHAVLFREWKGRIKGRDWYDWTWLVRLGKSLPLKRLATHMQYGGTLKFGETLDREKFKQLVIEKINQLDIEDARADMQPFVVDSAQTCDWSKDYFLYILSQTKITEE